MLKWLLHRKLAAFEREHGYDASYMHEVLDTDLGAFLKFARAIGIGAYRKDVPREVYLAAALTRRRSPPTAARAPSSASASRCATASRRRCWRRSLAATSRRCRATR